jgi:hypothetical protein
MKHLVITVAIYAATASPALADVKAASETQEDPVANPPAAEPI